jgi:2,4-dienoyl-CoA reductase-like NADH-dependent reductase (Old Yellow Enzyme family)
VKSKNLGGYSALLPSWVPKALSIEEIKDVVLRFAYAAKVCQDTGFTGVQLHAAHGYLLSSFLNPLANRRTDQYGGSVENRARLLLETVKAVREAVGPGYPVGVCTFWPIFTHFP